jgi:hypothetical protein
MSVNRSEPISTMSCVPLAHTIYSIDPSRASPVPHAYLHVCGVVSQIIFVENKAQLAPARAKPERAQCGGLEQVSDKGERRYRE